MFDTLLQLPLFQGLPYEDFTNIVEKVKLHFHKFQRGGTIVRANEPCDRLVFVLNGEAAASTTFLGGTYEFMENIAAPYLIEPQSLFGLKTVFVSTYTANCDTHTVSIAKPFLLNELFGYEIFRLNYVNMVSSRAQTLYNRLWSGVADGTEARIGQFILQHAERPGGEKQLKIKMEDLARLISETRQNVSRALNNMQEKGTIELRRGIIIAHDAALLAAG